MATKLEMMRTKAELLNVQAAKANAEMRIADHEENIGRLQASIEVSNAKEIELKQTISEMESQK